jgi:hypothetical protein
MGLKYLMGPGGPNCFESADVQLVDGERDIPYTGTLSAALARTTNRDCQRVGMIFDERSTLIVDCLHSDEDIAAFKRTCVENGIRSVVELAAPIAAPCPPPRNQLTLEDWRRRLFRDYRPVAQR